MTPANVLKLLSSKNRTSPNTMYATLLQSTKLFKEPHDVQSECTRIFMYDKSIIAHRS